MLKKFLKNFHNFLKLLFLLLVKVAMQMWFLIILILIMNLFLIVSIETLVFKQNMEFMLKICE
jgi:hypothetical protein